MFAYQASEDPTFVSRARRVPPTDPRTGQPQRVPSCEAPPKDSKTHGPRVILTAAMRGGANETYSVSIPGPNRATHHARTPTPGATAPSQSSA